jgi:transcription-repair coupling factor (superfamily II helicase)
MSLPRETLQRLQAIQEFTELGSGFNLAMRDMEIRGAGNLLGAEQSGFILEMGYEMYQRIVEEAVHELKTEEFRDLVDHTVTGRRETVIETDVEALIPDVYIASDSERLDVYRRLYQMGDQQEIDEMRRELQDRFGEYPPEVESLFKTVEIKSIAARLGMSKIEIAGQLLTLWLPPEGDAGFYENQNGGQSVFQSIMDAVTAARELRSQLRQDGKQLKLLLRLPQIREDQRLRSAGEILNRVVGSVSLTVNKRDAEMEKKP